MERIETERLVLRQTLDDDFAAFSLVHENPALELAAAVGHWEDHGFGPWSLFDRSSGDFVGVLEVHYAGRDVEGVAPDEVEMGWVIVAERRGAGLATEAALAAVADTLRRLGPPWIVAYVRPDNEPSLRIVEKLGMKPEGQGRARNGDSVLIFRLYPPR